MGIACERTASVAICDHSVAIASGSGSGSGLESAPPEEQYFRKEKAGGSSPPVGSKFNKTISLHLLDDFLSQKCGQGNALPQGCVSQLGMAGPQRVAPDSSECGGDRRRRDQSVRSGAQLADARVRAVGPPLRAEPTNRSFRRSATQRRVRLWLATRSGLSRQSLATSLL